MKTDNLTTYTMRQKLLSVVAVIALLMSCHCIAQVREIILVTEETGTPTATLLSSRPVTTDTIPVVQPQRQHGHFTWGADLGSSFDLTNQDLTSFDLSACFGYRNRAIRFFGLGAAIHMVTNNSSRAYPVYLQFRTTFRPDQQFVFLDVKTGISFFNLYNSVSRKPLYAALGIGFTLASGKNFSSHITLGYSFTALRKIEVPQLPHLTKDLHQAVIRLGVAF